MTDQNVTEGLSRWITELRPDDIEDSVRFEGVRTFVNWLGCAVGGARHGAVDAFIRAVDPFSGPRSSSVLGRSERLDALNASLANGISSHVLDFDDTHLKTIIHPAGPVCSALLSLSELYPCSGRELLTAQIIGTEVECRLGNCVYPDHYDKGWHITGTAGVFGSAAACGYLLGLGQRQMQWALGLAATQSSGVREMFGTMSKSFHPGCAARNGMMSALLARAGFDSSDRGIEAPRGWANVISAKQDYDEVLGDLGTRWESALNSYKPFACGIVIHPTIDGCLQIREEIGPENIGNIQNVVLRTAPLVLELTGKRTPSTGLEGKFSVFHAAACALLRGDGSPTAFIDEVVNLPEIIDLRDRVNAVADPATHESSVAITVTFNDGTTLEKHVDKAIGSLERPLDNDRIERKFVDQAKLVIGEVQARELADLSWRIEDVDNASRIASATVPLATHAMT